jgi:hypothetical protein
VWIELVAVLGQPARLKRDLAEVAVGSVCEQRIYLAPNHLVDDAVDISFRHSPGADLPTIAQHRVAITDLHHLLQAVSDEDDADSSGLHVSDDL